MIEKKGMPDFYVFYKQRSETPVAQSLYREIVGGYFKFLMTKVFDGFDIELSAGNTLGLLCIRGKKVSLKEDEDGNLVGLAVNWKATNELWARRPDLKLIKQLVYHLNEHSDGIRYSFKWQRNGVKLLNKVFYTFKASRKNKRTVPKMIRAGKEYMVNFDKIKD